MKARVSDHDQVSLPPAVRQALSLRPGDMVDIQVEGDRVVLSRLSPQQTAELRAFESTLGEWLSDEDEDAFSDL